MRGDFPTEQQLMAMPISTLRGLEIETPAQQELVQKIVDRRMSNQPVEHHSSNAMRTIDIQNQDQEAEWQRRFDEGRNAMRPIGQQNYADVELDPFTHQAVADEPEQLPYVGDPVGPVEPVTPPPAPVVEPPPAEPTTPAPVEPQQVAEPKRRGRPRKVKTE